MLSADLTLSDNNSPMYDIHHVPKLHSPALLCTQFKNSKGSWVELYVNQHM